MTRTAALVTEARFLRWVRGSLFREVHVHEAFLVGFDVDGAELDREHRAALDHLADAYAAADERGRRSERTWVDFDPPYVVGHPDGFDLVDSGWPDRVLALAQRAARFPATAGVPVRDPRVHEAVEDENLSGRFTARRGLYVRTAEPPQFGVLTGGASQTGPEAHNVDLSSLRGHAAAQYLMQERGVPAGAIRGVGAPGSSEPFADDPGAELAVNRSATLALRYAHDVVLLLDEDALARELELVVGTLHRNGLDGDGHVKQALGAYLVGRHALALAESADFAAGEGPAARWPDPKVPRSLTLPMAEVFAEGTPRSDRPRAPWERLMAAQRRRYALGEALARDAETHHGLLTPWTRALQAVGQRPELAHDLAVGPVSEDAYRSRARREFAGLPTEALGDLELGGHYDAVRPHFHWLTEAWAAEGEAVASRVTGREVRTPWFLVP